MASTFENFRLSGPVHLTAVNWEDTNYRRSVVASLVNGVYVLEHDRRKERQGGQALAPPWWDFFHFQLVRVLEDNADHSIFGAIYEFKFPPSYCYGRAPNPPRYVIAFRGTIVKLDTIWEDFKANTMLICNRSEKRPRFLLAMQEVEKMVDEAGAANIWLAGHSLGSAIALFTGKNMVKMGYPIETYLFNSPYISPPIEQFKINHEVKRRIRIVNSFIKAGASIVLKDPQQRRQENDTFVVLSAWVPYLFVNPSDPVCEGYIGYFGNREEMVELGAGGIERLATQNSTWGLFLRGNDSEPVHLLPSAHLTINQSQLTINQSQLTINLIRERLKQAHGIHQWWMPNLDLQSNTHQFDPAETSSVLNKIMGWIDARECE